MCSHYCSYKDIGKCQNLAVVGSHSCVDHKCHITDCMRKKFVTADICSYHKCIIGGCGNQRDSDLFCVDHKNQAEARIIMNNPQLIKDHLDQFINNCGIYA